MRNAVVVALDRYGPGKFVQVRLGDAQPRPRRSIFASESFRKSLKA